MNVHLANFPDGHLLLKFNGKHMFLNSPKYPVNFYGENVFDVIDDYCYWLKNNAEKLHWLDDKVIEV